MASFLYLSETTCRLNNCASIKRNATENISLTIRLLDWLNTGIKNVRGKLYAVRLQITTKKLFLKWSDYYLIFYYKLVINYAVLVRYFSLLGKRISAVKISSMLIAVVETTFTRKSRKLPTSSHSSNNRYP